MFLTHTERPSQKEGDGGERPELYLQNRPDEARSRCHMVVVGDAAADAGVFPALRPSGFAIS